MQKNKVVLTGGHAATTVLSVAEEIKKQKKSWELHFIGTKKAMEGKPVATLESKILPKAEIKFHTIVTGRLQRRFTFWTIPALLKIPIGFFQSLSLLNNIKPALILSFGGFAAFPVVVAGWVLRIPVILHEQTSAVGLANRLCAPFAKKVALSRKESTKYFPKEKTIITGNPVSRDIAKVAPKKKISIPSVIFITGGSRGSQALNALAFGILGKIVKDFIVVHQTGPLDIKKAKEARQNLSSELQSRYKVFANVDRKEMVKIYEAADIIVARSGANTVSEIMAVGRPAILMPIPWSYENEQRKNAQVLKKAGASLILDQEKASPETLYAFIRDVAKNWKRMAESFGEIAFFDNKASEKLVEVMEEFLG